MMTKEKYLENQQKVRELCLKLGLKERMSGYEIQFWVPCHSKIFAECVRMFKYEVHPIYYAVFFYDLEPYIDNRNYDYCFKSSIQTIKEDLNLDIKDNVFEFPITDKKLSKLETIIKADIQIAKEYSENLVIKEIKQDFN